MTKICERGLESSSLRPACGDESPSTLEAIAIGGEGSGEVEEAEEVEERALLCGAKPAGVSALHGDGEEEEGVEVEVEVEGSGRPNVVLRIAGATAIATHSTKFLTSPSSSAPDSPLPLPSIS